MERHHLGVDVRIAFVAPALAESTRECVRAALQRAGHDAVASPVEADLCLATWFGSRPPLPASTPLVRWWVGSDVLAALSEGTATHSRDERHNWVSHEPLGAELSSLGIGSRVLPILPAWEPEALPVASEPVVLLYCPDGREELYGWDRLVEVASRCPEVRFRVFRRKGPSPLGSIECVPGWTPHEQMRREYTNARAVLRLTSHDGMSLSVLEALGFGRHVIWTYPQPGCWHVESVDAAVEAVCGAVAGDINHAGVDEMRQLRQAAERG